ncbi:MAG TPA: thioredoxin domain-containing protein [Kofleriaceae bacterium]|nr:thioredoxin domain-containing protein [Kofleriaceae bacterium]
MRTRIAVLVVAATIAATTTSCVSSGKYKALERRVAQLEERETQRQLEVSGTLLRIEAQLAALAAGFGRLSDLGVEDLYAKITRLEEQLEKMGPARPPSRPVRPQPDPAKVYAVAVDDSPARGPGDALVTIVRAGEYACPFCEKTRATMDQLIAEYGSQIRVVHKDYIVHPTVATDAAHAACAAYKQGRFWELDELLWEKAFKTRQFEPAHLEQLAVEAGLDVARYRADIAGDCPARVVAEMKELTALGVYATPAFFVNGRFLSGAQPAESFRALIDSELALARTRVKKGSKRKRYYEDWVMKKGLTKLEAPAVTP